MERNFSGKVKHKSIINYDTFFSPFKIAIYSLAPSSIAFLTFGFFSSMASKIFPE